jgi:hypothetical protein
MRPHPAERAWVRTGAKIGYGVCVVLGCLAIGCAPWLLAVWAITGQNSVLGRIVLGSVLLAGVCIVASMWLNAKAGGSVNF